MLYFSTACIPSKDIERSIEELMDRGVRNIELSSDKNYRPNINDIVYRLKKRFKINFLIHNYFPPPREGFVINLASQNQSILNRTIEHCKAAIRMVAMLDAPVYSVHAGLRIEPHYSELGKVMSMHKIFSYEAAYDTLLQALKILCDYAARFGVMLLVENNVFARHHMRDGKNTRSFMCRHKEFLRLFNDVQKQNLGMLIDIGHLKITAKTLKFEKEEFIEKLKDKTRMFHLSDNNASEDTHGQLREHSWFWDELRGYKGMNYVIESRNLTGKDIEAIKRLFKEKLSLVRDLCQV